MAIRAIAAVLLVTPGFAAEIANTDEGRPGSGWPIFKDKKALEADNWGKYYKDVYGEVPSSGYPINTEDLMILYDGLLKKHGVTKIPHDVGKCPPTGSHKGVHYSGLLEAKAIQHGISWVWHPPPFHGMPKDTWVEVIHTKDPFNDEQHGAWMFKTVGSGTWFNIGKTMVFNEHQDAYNHFGVRNTDHFTNVRLSQAAAKAGLDSLQFIAHKDPEQYPCTKKFAMAHEILGVKLQGIYTCMSKSSPGGWLKAGWKHTSPCHCDSSSKYLNCHRKKVDDDETTSIMAPNESSIIV